MSFNRTIYDDSAYDLQMKRSTIPGDYRLFGPFAENIDPVISFNGPIGSKSDVSTAEDVHSLENYKSVDIESKLSWRPHKLSKTNNYVNNLENILLNHKNNNSKLLISEDTRFTNPIDDFRSMSLTSYTVAPYLPMNPHYIIQSVDTKIGLDSRSLFKDSYKIPKQTFIDTCEALPSITN
jgi:hypothetical protein